MSKKFALIGAAGYVAPRHMRAIKDTGNVLDVAMDINDSVGILDSHFPRANFFTEFERFDRYVDMLRRKDPKDAIEYVSICSPNYLHDAHIRFALRNEAHAICEKPLVLNPWNIDALARFEEEMSNKIYNILQLRHHQAILDLKEEVDSAKDKIYDIDLTYITSRGPWYHYSWKGDTNKSGGVATNIGIHFFDMLMWLFGKPSRNEVHLRDNSRCAGYIELENARVRWFLSVDEEDLPAEIAAAGQRTYRSLTMDNREIEFSKGFTDLHTVSYQNILDGKGFGIEDCRQAVECAYTIRHADTVQPKGDYHPAIKTVANCS